MALTWRTYLALTAFFVIFHFCTTILARTNPEAFLALYPAFWWVEDKLVKALLLASTLLLTFFARNGLVDEWFPTPPALKAVPTPEELESGTATTADSGSEVPKVLASSPRRVSLYTFMSFLFVFIFGGGYLAFAHDILSFDRTFIENVQSFSWAMGEGFVVLFVGAVVLFASLWIRSLFVRGE